MSEELFDTPDSDGLGGVIERPPDYGDEPVRERPWWLGWWIVPTIVLSVGIIILGGSYGFGHPGTEALIGVFVALLIWNLVTAWRASRRIRCPYCQGSIPSVAVVCRRCGRDV